MELGTPQVLYSVIYESESFDSSLIIRKFFETITRKLYDSVVAAQGEVSDLNVMVNEMSDSCNDVVWRTCKFFFAFLSIFADFLFFSAVARHKINILEDIYSNLQETLIECTKNRKICDSTNEVYFKNIHEKIRHALQLLQVLSLLSSLFFLPSLLASLPRLLLLIPRMQRIEGSLSSISSNYLAYISVKMSISANETNQVIF